MKVALLSSVLQEFEALVENIGGTRTLNQLRDLRELFSGYESSTVAQFIGKLEKAQGRSTGGALQGSRDLQIGLQKLGAVLVSANARGAASDLQKLVEFLDGCSQDSVAEFVAKARQSLTKQRSSRGGSSDNRGELVDEYYNDLKAASEYNDTFDGLANKLRTDKRIRTQEMREIAKLYLGYEIAKKKGRGPALQEITDHQALNARQVARGRSHDRG
jgi:hypothetical protein